MARKKVLKKKKKIKSVLNLNVKKLVRMMAFGHICSPVRYSDHEITPDGRAKVLPSLGSVVFDFDLGDSVSKFKADHLQPGVTVASAATFDPDSEENKALMTYACLGNTVTITNVYSEAKKEKGRVIGKHGGVNYLMVRFDKKVLEKINHNEEVKIDLYGIGLEDEDYPDVHIMNIAPSVLLAIPIKRRLGRLIFPVVSVIPAEAMGSGLGSMESFTDYDIQSTHASSKGLCIGDFVAISNHYAFAGPSFKRGSISIGVVVHGSCVEAGHGPGVLIMMTCKSGNLKTYIDESSNLKRYLK